VSGSIRGGGDNGEENELGGGVEKRGGGEKGGDYARVG